MNIMEDVQMDNKNTDIIKVIGVGGGGGNAVEHMYKHNVQGVSFLICNTDPQDLEKNAVPAKIQLGAEGLGAGADPTVAERYAEETRGQIEAALKDGTQMVFITAGMGGGTGTGAAPVIANIAKGAGLLTVGIVTLPFLFEGKNKIKQAIDGMLRLKDEVDSLLVINNEALCVKFADMSAREAYAKADDTLLTAAQSIANFIVQHGVVNIDFADVKRTLTDGGAATISVGYGEGEDRMTDAFNDATTSLLITNDHVLEAQRILFYITYGEGDNELKTSELKELNEIMERFTNEFNTIHGHGFEPTLGGKLKVTLLLGGIEDITTNDFDLLYDYYYGRYDNAMPKVHLYLFNDDTMTNERVISVVENTPTRSRTGATLSDIKAIN